MKPNLSTRYLKYKTIKKIKNKLENHIFIGFDRKSL